MKVVNPGGVELWKRGVRDRVGLDTPVGSDRVTPRAILDTLVSAANDLGLPHAAHIHCNDLGVAGNVATTLASMRAVEGRRAHFTHLQFHAYDAAPDGTILSRRLVKPSGNAAWDEAVLRAIDRTETLPKDDNGRVPSSIVIGFTPV